MLLVKFVTVKKFALLIISLFFTVLVFSQETQKTDSTSTEQLIAITEKLVHSKRDFETITHLIESGADINVLTKNGKPILVCFVEYYEKTLSELQDLKPISIISDEELLKFNSVI